MARPHDQHVRSAEGALVGLREFRLEDLAISPPRARTSRTRPGWASVTTTVYGPLAETLFTLGDRMRLGTRGPV